MRPIVAVIGTTGVGKSQLAVHLANCLQSPSLKGSGSSTPLSAPQKGNSGILERVKSYDKGVVLSADSMQLYKGLDVITNKVTTEEMGGVEHWGLDMVQPGQGGSWELGRWCTEADKVVQSLPETTLPIVCGGTHYFIQHFLFPPPDLSTARSSATVDGDDDLPAKPSSSRWTPPGPLPATPDLEPSLARLLESFWTQDPVWPKADEEAPGTSRDAAASSALGSASVATWTNAQLLALHRLLEALDPVEAGRWHWRDGRKVKRSLERWWESQCQVSDSTSGKVGGRRARFRTLIFWVYEPLETLRPRLDRRVDKMVDNGLLSEILELRGIAERAYGSAEAADHTEGIFQAIGYKEFAQLRIDPAAPLASTADPAFTSMLDRMKLSTHQYAKSQLKWVTKNLLPAAREARASGGDVWVYAVQGGHVNEAVTRAILHDFLVGGPMPVPLSAGHPLSKEILTPFTAADKGAIPDTAGRQTLNARRECSLCSTPSAPYSVMVKDWDIHVKSKLHKRNVVAADGGLDALIERQKLAGLARKEERARLKGTEAERADPA